MLRSVSVSLRGLLIAAVAVSAIGGAYAQHALQVFGKSNASACYDAVLKERSLRDSLELCTKALDEDGVGRFNRAATYVNRGIIHMRRGDNTSAQRDYQIGLDLLPDMPEGYTNLGAMLYNLGEYEQAIDVLNRGLTADLPENRAAAFYNRALAFERLGRIEAAYQDYRAALMEVPEYAPAAEQVARFQVVPRS